MIHLDKDTDPNDTDLRDIQSKVTETVMKKTVKHLEVDKRAWNQGEVGHRGQYVSHYLGRAVKEYRRHDLSSFHCCIYAIFLRSALCNRKTPCT